MSIRIPINLKSQTFANELGATSVSGGIPILVNLPQDTDNIIVKFKASMVGAVSATFQTTDDGGTTWYDVQRTSVVSNANNDLAEFLSIPVINAGQRSNTNIGSVVAAGSTIASGAVNATIGSAGASTLSSKEISGLPIMSQLGRVFIRITGNVTSAASNSMTAEVKVNSQSATA